MPAILEFRQIPHHEKNLFRPIFQEYLEEQDLVVGDAVEPDFSIRCPNYHKFFENNPNFQPFRIYVVMDSDLDLNKLGIAPESPVGFFFLKLIRPNEIPQGIIPLCKTDDDVFIANLSEFSIFPKYRKHGLAWAFYESIIRLANENRWHVCWETDIRNKPALGFYEKVLERIEYEYKYEVSKQKYIQNERKKEYYFYQVKFQF